MDLFRLQGNSNFISFALGVGPGGKGSQGFSCLKLIRKGGKKMEIHLQLESLVVKRGLAGLYLLLQRMLLERKRKLGINITKSFGTYVSSREHG